MPRLCRAVQPAGTGKGVRSHEYRPTRAVFRRTGRPSCRRIALRRRHPHWAPRLQRHPVARRRGRDVRAALAGGPHLPGCAQRRGDRGDPGRMRPGHQRRRAAPGAEVGRGAARHCRFPSPRLAGADRRRRCARRAHRAPRHGARHRAGMAQPDRWPHRGAAAARHASWRGRGRPGADTRQPTHRHVHLRPAPARAGDPRGHGRARARPVADRGPYRARLARRRVADCRGPGAVSRGGRPRHRHDGGRPRPRRTGGTGRRAARRHHPGGGRPPHRPHPRPGGGSGTRTHRPARDAEAPAGRRGASCHRDDRRPPAKP